MVEKTPYIWFQGKITAWEDASVHVLTHALHYGSGVFEGIRCYDTDKGPAVFRLDEHIDRLFSSASALLMQVPYTKEEIKEAITKTIKKNSLRTCYIRPIIYYGAGPMGLDTTQSPVHVAIICWKWGAYLGEDGIKNGIRALFSTQLRHPGPLNKAKICGSYVVSSLAKREALKRGYDEAIMLDSDGYLAEGSGENLFIIKDKIIRTPKPNSILEGITRDAVMTIARELGFTIEEADLTKDDLLFADEAFFTGTAVEVTPIRCIEDKVFKSGPGPVTKKIQSAFFTLLRKGWPHEEWFTHIA